VVWIFPAGLAGMLPLFFHWELFTRFFYRGDEWDQLHRMDSQGYLSWLFGFFGENFVPVFKLVWSGLLIMGGGSHFVFVVFSFLLHFCVVILFGYLLRLWGFGLISVVFSQSILALNYTSIEIHSQSIQFSNLLSYLFSLLALLWCSKGYLENRPLDTKEQILILIYTTLGVLCFVRGVVIGPAILLTVLLMGTIPNFRIKNFRMGAVCCLVPCVLSGIFVGLNNLSQSVGDKLLNFDSVGFGTHLFYQLALNPLYQQIRGLEISNSTASVLLLLNIILVGVGFYFAHHRQQLILGVLFLFFVGNCILLAYGRKHTPIDHVATWRYQYVALLALLPLFSILLERILCLVRLHNLRIAATALLLIWTGWYVYKPWSVHLHDWTNDYGLRTRDLLEQSNLSVSEHDISQFQFIANARARELAEKYNLH